jgi:hypothetical protein
MWHQGVLELVRGSAVRKPSTTKVLMIAMLASCVTIAGLVSLPGVGDAGKVPRPRLFYLSLGDSYSVGYQPGKGATVSKAVTERSARVAADFAGGTPGWT